MIKKPCCLVEGLLYLKFGELQIDKGLDFEELGISQKDLLPDVLDLDFDYVSGVLKHLVCALLCA